MQTVLRKAGLYGRVDIKKPLLRTFNKVKRLKWAKKHILWTKEAWRKTLFTDETKCELFGNGHRRVYIRRSEGEKMIEDCIVSTAKHGGVSIMLLGCFENERVGDLIKINGMIKKEQYHQILIKHAIPSGLKLIGKPFHFRKDNDPKHTFILCKTYLQKKADQHFLHSMEHPPQSPDCNPIEYVWDELDIRLRKLRPKNHYDLWTHQLCCFFICKLIKKS